MNADIREARIMEGRKERRRQAKPSELGCTWHPKEQEWLTRFRAWLVTNHAKEISDIIVYGSKARGDWNEDSDIDVLLIVKDEAEHIQKELCEKGYDLADHSVMLPSILTRTEGEWAARAANGLLFHEQVERDGVSVLLTRSGTDEDSLAAVPNQQNGEDAPRNGRPSGGSG